MGTYSDHEQRLLDQQTGEEMDRHAQRVEAKASNLESMRALMEQARDALRHAGPVTRELVASRLDTRLAQPDETPAPPECEYPGCHGEHDTDSTHCKATCFVQGETKRCEREPNHGGGHTVQRRNTTPFRWYSPEKTTTRRSDEHG